MLKKILILMIFLFSFLFSNNVFAEVDGNAGEGEAQKVQTTKVAQEAAAKSAADLQKRNENCDAKGTCLDRPSFTIDTDNFSIGGTNLKQNSGISTVNKTLGVFIQKLMIVLGTLCVVIIMVGSYHMMLYHGDDTTLSKGKNTIKGGIIGLIVALSSYYIVNMVGYVLYK